MTNYFNDFYASIGIKFAEKIQNSISDNCYPSQSGGPHSLYLFLATPQEVSNIMCSLSYNKVLGFDYI